MVDEDQAAAAGPAVATEPAPVGSPRSGHDLDSGPRPRFSITADEPVAGAAGLGIAESIALIILFAAGALIPVLLSTGLHTLTGFRIGPGGRLVLAELCGGTLALVFAVRWSGRPFREVCPLRPFPTGVIPGLVLGSIGLRAVLGELGSWTPGAERVMEGLGQMLSGGVVSYMIAVWLLAPVLEELLFRGAMLSGLRVRRSAVTAIVVSAMLFACPREPVPGGDRAAVGPGVRVVEASHAFRAARHAEPRRGQCERRPGAAAGAARPGL